MSTEPIVDARANPLAGNPLVTKADVQRAVVDLVEPVVAHLSPGGARARLGSFGAVFPERVAELEGWARPLWGIVPLVAGGGEFAHWDRWVAGLAHGTDPDHDEYWGSCSHDIDQRMVEMAAIGYALAFTPEHLWDPLDGATRDRVVEWLRGIERFEPARNNWQFFRLLVQMGLERVGVAVDVDSRDASIAAMETFATANGWYTDGAGGNVDWYVPFAIHTYGLVLSASGLGDRDAAARWVERSREFAPQFRHWFAPDGGAVPWGRSLTYRFAIGSIWGALAQADVDALPWGEVRGLALRHLRWWRDQPISDRDGVVSVGYAYDNRRLAETYNSAGSPYWCMKAFTMLAAPDDHPFWTEPECASPLADSVTVPEAGMVVGHDAHHAVALNAPRPGGWSFVEESAAKYQKFAYSSRYGFSGDFAFFGVHHATDSMLAVSDTASGVRGVRHATTMHEVADGVALARWSPLPGVTVDTALAGGAPWHLRVHRITTDREIALVETGFAMPWDHEGFAPAPAEGEPTGSVTAQSPWGASVLVDRSEAGRAGEVRGLPPNANLMHPHAMVPALVVTVPPGSHVVACAVGASPDAACVDPQTAPTIPAGLVDRLEEFAARPESQP